MTYHYRPPLASVRRPTIVLNDDVLNDILKKHPGEVSVDVILSHSDNSFYLKKNDSDRADKDFTIILRTKTIYIRPPANREFDIMISGGFSVIISGYRGGIIADEIERVPYPFWGHLKARRIKYIEFYGESERCDIECLDIGKMIDHSSHPRLTSKVEKLTRDQIRKYTLEKREERKQEELLFGLFMTMRLRASIPAQIGQE